MSNIQVGQVAMVPLSSIYVGERARKEYGDLNELESSMKESGLIQPLAVMEIIEDKYNGYLYELLGGGRRFMILEKNNTDIVPVRVFPNDLSLEEMKSIELAENFYRKDFEYWEYDSLVREIHELKQSIHGPKAPGPDSQGWGLEDTVNLIGSSKPSVSTAIKRAEAREAFPELFSGCKTQKDATTVIKKMDELVVKEVIAKKLESEKSDNTFSQLAKRYVLRDCMEGIKDIPDSVYHLIEIDPPYAIKLTNAKKTDGESIYQADDYNEIDEDKYLTFMEGLFKECYRVMTPNSWLLSWFAPEPWFAHIYRSIKQAGFSTTRMCGIWTKPTGQSKRPEIHLANSYEMFFYAWKGRPALNRAGRSNNFNYSPVPPACKTHPTERPVDLMKDIYDTFAFPGSRVLIPFLGSGNGILAASQLGMEPLGFELSRSYRDSFLIKLNGLKGV